MIFFQERIFLNAQLFLKLGCLDNEKMCLFFNLCIQLNLYRAHLYLPELSFLGGVIFFLDFSEGILHKMLTTS